MAQVSGGTADEATPPARAAEMAREVAAAVARADGAASDAVPDEPSDNATALAALATLHSLRGLLTAWEPRLIEQARAGGTSWARLAPLLGVTSRQAAERRYLRLRPGDDAAMTREQRVRAARDERAGERAVAGWARDNASHLRQVAGQASAVSGLGGVARRRARDLRDSLDGEDPSALLEPLRAMHEHLGEDQAALADKVRVITRKVERVRRDTQRDRDRTGD